MCWGNYCVTPAAKEKACAHWKLTSEWMNTTKKIDILVEMWFIRVLIVHYAKLISVFIQCDKQQSLSDSHPSAQYAGCDRHFPYFNFFQYLFCTCELLANSQSPFPPIPPVSGDERRRLKFNTQAVSLRGDCLDKLQIQSKSIPLSHGRVFSGFPRVENKLPGTRSLPSVCAGPAERGSLIRVSVLVTKDWFLSVNSQAALFLIPHYCFSSPLYLTDPYLPPSLPPFIPSPCLTPPPRVPNTTHSPSSRDVCS